MQGSDIVLLNEDSKEAVSSWEGLEDSRNCPTLIKVTSNKEAEENALVLSRPLSLKKLMTALETATSLEASRSANDEVSNVETRRVLVVDDSYSVRKYMEHKLPELSDMPLNLEFADSGEAAIEKFGIKEFDMVFLDVVMPGKDGYQVCKWIKAEHSAFVVMLTSKKSPFDKVRGNMSGCNAYITKPPKDEHIQKVLKKALAVKKRKQVN